MTTSLIMGQPAPLSSARGEPRRRRWDRWLPAMVLLAPSLFFLVLFTYWPVARVVGQSLLVGRFSGDNTIGLGNYQRLFADPHFTRAAWNNLVYALGTIVPSLIFALAFALGLREATRLNTLLRTLVVMPLLIPLVAAAALFSFLLLPGDGLVDFYLARFGLGMVNWLGDPDLALGSVIAITVWKNTGYYMLFFLAGLAGIPDDLNEAAMLEGAGPIRRFRYVTFPLLGPTLAFVLVIALLNVLTQVDHIVVMTDGGPSDATNVLLFYIYQQAHQNNDAGLAAAATMVSVVVLFLLSAGSLRALERGIHYES
ncbi:MAG TPA: sugar ABC transporter permease [Stellaceae bacterium]|nr:sugar ABC transporter permease [Stellaceae bacterium]